METHTKSSFCLAQSQASKDMVIGQLKLLAAVWDGNTQAGCNVRQALRYAECIDFQAPTVFEQVQEYYQGQGLERAPE